MPSYIFVISVLVALINFTLAALAICRHDKLSLYLGGVLIASTLVDITYTISLIAEDNFAQMSWWTSAYFSSMVVLCLLVAGYISNFTENTLIKRPGPFAVVMTCLTIADVALLMTNPLTELVMDYRYVDNSLTSWLFEPKPLYYLHTLLSNTAVAFAIACLCKRIREVPRVYLRRYLAPLLTIVCLAAANALFFCLRDPEVPDFSVYLYGFGGIAFYAMPLSLCKNARRNGQLQKWRWTTRQHGGVLRLQPTFRKLQQQGDSNRSARKAARLLHA